MENNMFMENLQEYNDPILYDDENEDYIGEIDLLMAYAKQTSKPIIDLACGTGRLTIPLASKGYNVFGIDIHKGMLQRAKEKADSLGITIKWIQSNCIDMNLATQSDLVYMVGNSIQHFHTNESQDMLLQAIRRHLSEKGVFIFGTRFPSREELFQPEEETYWKTFKDDQSGHEVDVYTASKYNPVSQIQEYVTIRKYKNSFNKVEDEKTTHIKLRYVFPKEMERILTQNGFKIIQVFGNWDGSPLGEDSHQMVYVCKQASLTV